MITPLLLFVSLVLAQFVPEPEPEKCYTSNITFIQSGGVIRVGSTVVKAGSPSGDVFEPQKISLQQCECPNVNSLGCTDMLSGATFSVSPFPTPNVIGGTVQFTTKTIPGRGDGFGVGFGSTTSFLPILSMVRGGAVFPKSLVNGTWTFGLCSEFDLKELRIFHLCYIARIGDSKSEYVTSVVLDSAIDVTGDIVTFAFSKAIFKRPIDLTGKLDVVLTRPSPDNKLVEKKSYDVAIPPPLTDGVLRIGYQGVTGLSAKFDTFYGLSIDEAFDFDRARAISPYLCIRQYGTLCDRKTEPATTSAASTEESTVSRTTSGSDATTASDSTTAIIDENKTKTTTTTNDRLTGTRSIVSPLDMGSQGDPLSQVDWFAVGLFIAAGVLIAIGGAIVTIVLNRRQ